MADSIQTGLRLPTDLYSRAKEQAEREGRTVSQLIRVALIRYLERADKPERPATVPFPPLLQELAAWVGNLPEHDLQLLHGLVRKMGYKGTGMQAGTGR